MSIEFALILSTVLVSIVALAFVMRGGKRSDSSWRWFAGSYALVALGLTNQMAAQLQLAIPWSSALSYLSLFVAALLVTKAFSEHSKITSSGISSLPSLCMAVTAFAILAAGRVIQDTWGVDDRTVELERYVSWSQIGAALLLMVSALCVLARIRQDAFIRSFLNIKTNDLLELHGRTDDELDRASAPNPGSPSAVMMCDLDRFKAVNDKHGPAIADKIVQEFYGLAHRLAPDGSTLDRTGADSFSILVPVELEKAADLADELRAEWQRTSTGILGYPTTVSIGLAEVRAHDIGAAMRHAGAALQAVKAHGRNRSGIARTFG